MSLIRLINIIICLLFITAGFYNCQNPSQNDSSSSKTESRVDSKLPQNISIEKYPEWISEFRKNLKWVNYTYQNKLNREILIRSLNLGLDYMIKNQKPEGNLRYINYFIENVPEEREEIADNQVRQAGALWALSLIYQYNQSASNKIALERGLDFFFKHTIEGPVEGTYLITYPYDRYCKTGTVALVALAIIEYLRLADDGKVKLPDNYKGELVKRLNGYIKFLRFMYFEDNRHFSAKYDLLKNLRWEHYNQYSDGEALLCLIKAAKYAGYKELIPLMQKTIQ